MKKSKVYIGCSLTKARPEFKNWVIILKKDLAKNMIF
jgi:hypothetical protein